MKRNISKRWFYGLVGMLNLIVGVMFLVVNIRPEPVLALSAVSTVRRVPLPPRIIPATVGVPTRLVIPSLSIDVPVGIGSYNQNDGSWTVDDTKAYYADNSMLINNSNGNTLIYGHAQAPIFIQLPNIQPRSEALVYTDSGYTFHYIYQSLLEVAPTDTSVFRTDGPPALVLQTCMGNWDAYRGLFSFSLQSVDKT